MDDQAVYDLMFNADYMTKMKSALSSRIYGLLYGRNGKQLMWKVYSSAGTITIGDMQKIYELKELGANEDQ